MRLWAIARSFVQELSAAANLDGGVRAIFPDAGSAAMLKNGCVSEAMSDE